MQEKGNILLGILIGLIIAGGMFGAYYFGTGQASKVAYTGQLGNRQIDQELNPTSSPSTLSEIPDNWLVKKSELCNVSMLLPPKEAPYITSESNLNEDMDSGAYWQFGENSQYSMDLFTRSANVFYRNPRALGSGYIAGSVFVNCSPNNGYTTDTLLAAYEKKFADGTYQGFEIKSKKMVNKWGKQVWEIVHSGGMYDDSKPTFYFATPSHIYSVNRISLSKNQFVKETTEKIFGNLRF